MDLEYLPPKLSVIVHHGHLETPDDQQDTHLSVSAKLPIPPSWGTGVLEKWLYLRGSLGRLAACSVAATSGECGVRNASKGGRQRSLALPEMGRAGPSPPPHAY